MLFVEPVAPRTIDILSFVGLVLAQHDRSTRCFCGSWFRVLCWGFRGVLFDTSIVFRIRGAHSIPRCTFIDRTFVPYMKRSFFTILQEASVRSLCMLLAALNRCAFIDRTFLSLSNRFFLPIPGTTQDEPPAPAQVGRRQAAELLPPALGHLRRKPRLRRRYHHQQLLLQPPARPRNSDGSSRRRRRWRKVHRTERERYGGGVGRCPV